MLNIKLEAWFSAHPNSIVKACFDDHCQLIKARAPSGSLTGYVRIQGDSSAAHPKTRYRLTVTAAAGDALHPQHQQLSLAPTVQESCAPFPLARALLTAQGRLKPDGG